ncbi:MAG TPA: hypothetical protein VEG38_05655 [Acidimicrobiia bacterium]|nr:hypothetical protein [Acidimicrobiia bacterium]
MILAFKALGATCLAGALTASGVVTSDHFTGERSKAAGASATVTADPHAILESLAVGEETQVSAADAGTVSVKRTASGLEVVAVTPADGWTAETRTLAADWIVVQFETPGRKVDVSLDIVGEHLRIRRAAFEVDIPTTTTTEPTTTTTTEPPTTTTTTAPPPPVTLPPPVQPTVIPVAGAGSVVIVLQGPVIVVQQVKVVPGWVASVGRRSGDIDVVFRKGDHSFRFFAGFKDRRLWGDIRELRADGEHRLGFDGRDGREGDGRGDRDGDRRGDGDDDRRDGDRDGDGRRGRH